MDHLRIESTGLLHTRPSGSASTQGGKRRQPAKPGNVSSVRISYEKEIERTVAQTLDTESGRVAGQLPPEEVVACLKGYRKAVPLIVDTTV